MDDYDYDTRCTTCDRRFCPGSYGQPCREESVVPGFVTALLLAGEADLALDGGAVVTAPEARAESVVERQMRLNRERRAHLDAQGPSRAGCGTTGCEAHDGECRNGWEGMLR